MSKGYVFQPSFLELLETFDRPADRDALNMAIHRFMFKGEEPVFKNIELKRAWIGLFPYLSKSRKTSISMSKETSNNLPRNFEDTSKILPRNSEQSSKKLLSRDKDKEKDIEKRESKEKRSASASPVVRFSKPTLDQIKEHISEKGYHFDAESFYAFYESKGWKVGNQSMKDWKMACVTWEKRMPKTETEPEEERHELTPMTHCKLCGSRNVSTRGLFSNCLQCGQGFMWNGREWREEV